MNRKINSLLWIGLMVTLIIGTSFFVNIYQAFYGDNTIWWTNKTMMLPIEKTTDNFELYISGNLLQKHLSEKDLFAADPNGKQYLITTQDIKVRLNNWDKTKASILTNAVISAFVFGIAITLLVIGLFRFFQSDKKSIITDEDNITTE